MKKISLFFISTFLIFMVLGAIGLEAQTLKPGNKSKRKAVPSKKGKPRPSTKASATFSSSDFVEKMDKGQINWTGQYVEAEGNSVMDMERFKIPNQAKLMAQRGAIVDAQRNLLEIVNGVLVEGQTTVKDLVVQSDEVKTKVSGMLKGAVQVGNVKFEDGVATVRLRIPLYADGLAEAVDTTPSPAPDPNVVKLVEGDSVPQEIMIAVNGTYKPRLFPKLTDDQNKIILDMAEAFDPSNGKAPQVVKQGMAAYEALKGKKGVELLEAAQDQFGNLVLNQKSKNKLEKWKKAGLLVWGIVKKLILPI